MKFVIVSPRQKWGGAIVLHALCRHLTSMGHDARIFYTNTYLYRPGKHALFWCKWLVKTGVDLLKCGLARMFGTKLLRFGSAFEGYVDVPVRGCKRKLLPWVSQDTIVVYPEGVFGNFLHAKHVVRWLLYHEKYKAEKDLAYGPNDLFLCYREIFNDPDLNPRGLKVATPHFDLEMYRQTNFGPREGTCYILRKGKERADVPQQFDGVIIDDLPEAEKVQVFNRCRYCVSYDTQTAYTSIAALCGCTAVIMPEPGKTIADYRSPGERPAGVAWGFDEEELRWAESTRAQVLQRYETLNRESRASAESFVALCREHFGLA